MIKQTVCNLMKKMNMSRKTIISVLVISAYLSKAPVCSVKINTIDCGVDHNEEIITGDIDVDVYPWLGVLYYTDEDMQGYRSVTPVALIQPEFCVASAADIGDMPKKHFRKNTRVLLGENWNYVGRRVRNYMLHPQYDQTLNTIAIIHLKDRVTNGIRHLCPPPDILKDPEFYVVKFKTDYNVLRKEVLPMFYVPRRMCRDFYVAANLYEEKMRPPYVVCACSVEQDNVCVWDAGAALVTRDVWGRWLFLGFGVRGPGCGAPSRYLDMLSYYPWLHQSLNRFQKFTVSKITPHKYVIRSAGPEVYKGYGHAWANMTNVDDPTTYTRYGECDPEEQEHIMYRDIIKLVTSNNEIQFLRYNISFLDELIFTCLNIEILHGKGNTQLQIRHHCPRESWGPACHSYGGSVYDLSIWIMFQVSCSLEIIVWGQLKNMTLIDIMEWKWEEGAMYKDFAMQREEYRGPTFMTTFGFEPLDPRVWIPDYDVWTTTDAVSEGTTSTSTIPSREAYEHSKGADDWDWSKLGPWPTRRPKSKSTMGWRKRTKVSTVKPKLQDWVEYVKPWLWGAPGMVNLSTIETPSWWSGMYDYLPSMPNFTSMMEPPTYYHPYRKKL